MPTIETFRVSQFTAGIAHLAQQEFSRFRGKVRIESISSADEASFDQLGSTDLFKRTTRNTDTPIHPGTEERRWVTPVPYERGRLIDKPDLNRILNDPTQGYGRAFAMGAGRTMDDAVIAAALASARTGEDGAGSATFTAGNTISDGGAGLTSTKIFQALEILNSNEEGEDMGEETFLAIGSRQVRDMLTENFGSGDLPQSPIGNMDFSTSRALQDGKVIRWGGFNIFRSERLDVASSVRSCLAWSRSALLLAMLEEPQVRIDERPDKAYSTQIYLREDLGATRMRETGVVEVQCLES